MNKTASLGPRLGASTLDPARVRYIVVHSTETGPDQDLDVAAVDRLHRQRGLDSIGYHYLIRRDGTPQPARPTTQCGAHLLGHNHESVAVCLVGGSDGTKAQRPQANYTPAQLDSLSKLVEVLTSRFPQAMVFGLNDFEHAESTSPAFDVIGWSLTGEVTA